MQLCHPRHDLFQRGWSLLELFPEDFDQSGALGQHQLREYQVGVSEDGARDHPTDGMDPDNDTELKFVTGNWPGVIEVCINNNFYPKVLFYEKLENTEDDVEYKLSRGFKLTKSKLEDLALLALDLDRLATASMEDLYGMGEEDLE